ncbi:MAG: hypothetical protein ACTIDE_01830 [Carnobacterium maltaromaticum]
MTRIDESKQYKFSEIAVMLENKELPKGTILFNDYYTNHYPLIVTEELYCNALFTKASGEAPKLDNRLISYSWTIKMPKEDKFYLKAPGAFKSKYLNLHIPYENYFLSDNCGSETYQTQFTQKEIDTMPFDTNFFEKVKLEQADE